MGISSQVTRELALSAVEAGDVPLRQIAMMFKVHRTTLYRWIHTHRTSGRTAPLDSGHRRSSFMPQELQRLDQLLTERPDTTLQQLRRALGKSCSIMSVHRALQGLGWRYKKNRYERTSDIDPT